VHAAKFLLDVHDLGQGAARLGRECAGIGTYRRFYVHKAQAKELIEPQHFNVQLW